MIKKRILVVDDDATVTRMVKLNLEKTGAYEVRAENIASQALASARTFKPDLIFLDVVMPEMDGGDVAFQLENDRDLKQVPVVFLTAMVAPEEAGTHGMISGKMRFLAKPVNLKNLIQSIQENLR